MWDSEVCGSADDRATVAAASLGCLGSAVAVTLNSFFRSEVAETSKPLNLPASHAQALSYGAIQLGSFAPQDAAAFVTVLAQGHGSGT